MTQRFTGELGDSYRPGVDLFVVYNQSWEAADLGAPVERDRRLIVKSTYPLDF